MFPRTAVIIGVIVAAAVGAVTGILVVLLLQPATSSGGCTTYNVPNPPGVSAPPLQRIHCP